MDTNLPIRNADAREKLVQRVLMAALLLVCIASDAFLAQEYVRISLIDGLAVASRLRCC